MDLQPARPGQTALELDAISAKAGFEQTEASCAALARDDINSQQLKSAIQAVAESTNARPQAEVVPEVAMRQGKAAGAGSGILVAGVDGQLTGLARCCTPAPPDPIAGSVTRGMVVTLHRARKSTPRRPTR